MKKFSSVFSCFHTDIMNKYIFPVQQKISGNSWKFSITYFSGKATSLLTDRKSYLEICIVICWHSNFGYVYHVHSTTNAWQNSATVQVIIIIIAIYEIRPFVAFVMAYHFYPTNRIHLYHC